MRTKKARSTSSMESGGVNPVTEAKRWWQGRLKATKESIRRTKKELKGYEKSLEGIAKNLKDLG